MEVKENIQDFKTNKIFLQKKIKKIFILNIVLIILCFILKIFDILSTIVGLYLGGASELNFLGFLFQINPALVIIISFIFIIILLILVVYFRDDLYCQKCLLGTAIIFNILLFAVIISNSRIIMVLL